MLFFTYSYRAMDDKAGGLLQRVLQLEEEKKGYLNIANLKLI